MSINDQLDSCIGTPATLIINHGDSVRATIYGTLRPHGASWMITSPQSNSQATFRTADVKRVVADSATSITIFV